MKILIFTEGTVIMPTAATGLARNEIEKQGRNKAKIVHDYASFIPIGDAVGKLNNWAKQGAEIVYLTSRRKQAEIQDSGINQIYKQSAMASFRWLFTYKSRKMIDNVIGLCYF